MHVWQRAAVAAVLVAPWLTVLGTAPADAAAPKVATLHVAKSNWFWREQKGAVDSPAGPVGIPAAAPDPTVPAGDLVVAGPDDDTGTPDKESYVALDLASLPAHSVLTRFTLTVPIDKDATQGYATTPDIVAVRAINDWTDGTGATAIAAKPQDDLTSAVTGKYDDKSSAYVFDLSSIATAWLAGDINTGVGLRLKDSTQAAQVVFKPAKAITASAAYTPPATGDTGPPLTSGNSTTGTSTPTDTSGSSGSGSGALPPPVSSGGLPPSSTSSGPPDTPPDLAPEPDAPAPVVAAPAAATLHHASSMPPTGFWIGAALLAALVVVAGVVLSNPHVEVRGASTDGALGRLLELRRRGSTSTLTNLTASPTES